MFKPKRLIAALALCALIIVAAVPSAQAVCNPDFQTCSATYGVNEAFFGSGYESQDPCSATYCSKQALGEVSVGLSTSASYRTQAGFNTDRYPSLTLVVNDSQCSYYNSSTNLGYLSTSSATTANANFSVKSYLASGYAVQTVGSPPTYSGHQLAPLTSGGSSAVGTEQFGMNLVANTSPTTFGADPQQLPSPTFSFGAPAAGYGTANSYKYNDGDVIANSNSSSGTTCYAASYIFNISGVTPAGEYHFVQSIVATATF